MIHGITSKGRAGFTLMEVALAAAILALALVGLLGAFAANFRLIESGSNLTIAVNHAQCVMEEVRDMNIPSFITAQDWTSWAQRDITHADGGGGCNTLIGENVQVSYPAGAGVNPLEVLVTVTWTEKGQQRSVELVSLITER